MTDKTGQDTGTGKNGKKASSSLRSRKGSSWSAAEDARWRYVEPQRDIKDALADFCDLCFRPPEDINEPNLGDRGCTSPTAGMALVALEALYDKQKMQRQREIGRFDGTEDTVKHALSALFAMETNPDRHLYKPVHHDDTPPRDPNIALSSVIATLIQGIERDFKPEVTSIAQRLAEQRSQML